MLDELIIMKNSILYINPGPTFKPHDPALRRHYEHLSRYFQGAIFSTSSREENFSIGKFQFISLRFKPGFSSFLKYRKFCYHHAENFMRKGHLFSLVTTYDPLKTGLIGAGIAQMHNSKFAPEVNGVYTSPAEWVDNPYSFINLIKKRIYPRIMLYVLKRSDGARLLFPSQIDPFRNVMKNKVVRDFRRWVDPSLFVPIRENKEVLFVGFPFKRKGVDVLIEAFKKVAPDYPDWKLKILGWFPDPTELNDAIGEHPQIYHHPPVHFSDMPRQIGSCAILVLPSRSEAMGRVLIEAMAAAKPRIGSNVDGIPTVINDRVDGLLVEPGDVADLASKLGLLMGNPELRKMMGEAGLKRVKKEFTEQVYIQNVVKFYNEVLES